MPVSTLLRLAAHRAQTNGFDICVLPFADTARIRRHPPKGHWIGYLVSPDGSCLPMGV